MFPLAEYTRQTGAGAPEPGRLVKTFNVSCQVLSEDVFFLADVRVVRGRRL